MSVTTDIHSPFSILLSKLMSLYTTVFSQKSDTMALPPHPFYGVILQHCWPNILYHWCTPLFIFSGGGNTVQYTMKNTFTQFQSPKTYLTLWSTSKIYVYSKFKHQTSSKHCECLSQIIICYLTTYWDTKL